jgi:cytochrome P450
LARLESQIAFEEMLTWFPHWSLEPAPLVWRTNLGIRGLTSLPVNFSGIPAGIGAVTANHDVRNPPA